jgi:hypothetical protein
VWLSKGKHLAAQNNPVRFPRYGASSVSEEISSLTLLALTQALPKAAKTAPFQEIVESISFENSSRRYTIRLAAFALVRVNAQDRREQVAQECSSAGGQIRIEYQFFL